MLKDIGSPILFGRKTVSSYSKLKFRSKSYFHEIVYAI